MGLDTGQRTNDDEGQILGDARLHPHTYLASRHCGLSGAGKSYAFQYAMANKAENEEDKRVLFIVPTRRLAQNLAATLVDNLVKNAIKFTRREGKVMVRFFPQADRILFEVSDTGMGISPMDQARIFEKFYRAPQPDNQPGHGSGLGLAIVRSVAEWHCGQVWVESQLGKGSSFYLAIPLDQKTCSDTENKI